MTEPELGPWCKRHLIDQFRVEELRQWADIGEFGQQVLVESDTDDGGRVERLFRCSIEAVDPGRDRGLKGRRDGDIGVVLSAHIFTACPREHVPVGEVTDDRLGEEGISGRALGDLPDQPGN